jgi:hypothetical protein
MKDYLIWVKHEEGSSAPYVEANPVHADGLNMDDGTRHQSLDWSCYGGYFDPELELAQTQYWDLVDIAGLELNHDDY